MSTTTWQKEEHLVNAKCNAGSSREALDSAILSDLASDTVSAQVHVPGIRQIGKSSALASDTLAAQVQVGNDGDGRKTEN